MVSKLQFLVDLVGVPRRTEGGDSVGTIIPVIGMDRVSVGAEWTNAATDAVVELRKLYKDSPGDGVSITGTPVELTKSVLVAEAVEVQDCPYIEFIVTTAGSANDRAVLTIYPYQTR